jgi:spermidine synthase
MALDEPDRLALDYTRVMMGFLLFNPDPRHIVMIGLGGGSLAKYCLATLPRTRFTAVEIDPAVIDLREAFGVPPDGPRFSVVRADGADYVRELQAAPDVLLVDGYDAGGLPLRLSTSAFYDDCRAMLADDGVLVANLWAGDPRYGVYASRIRDSFDGRVVAVRAEEGTNRIVFARKGGRFPPGRVDVMATAHELARTHTVDFVGLAQRLLHRLARPCPPRAEPGAERASRRRRA